MEQLYLLNLKTSPGILSARRNGSCADVRLGQLLRPAQSVRRNFVVTCALTQTSVRSGVVSTSKAIDEVLQAIGSVKVGKCSSREQGTNG